MIHRCNPSLRWAAAAAVLVGCSPETPAPPTETFVEEALGTGQINGSGLPAKTVVLTYDDGPDDHTLELAHYLADEGVRATFFVNGRRFCKAVDTDGKCLTPQDTRPCDNGQSQAKVAAPKYYPEAWLDEVVSLGHRIGNHTQDHCHLPGETSVANLAFEVKTTQDILDRHVCDNVFLFRAPYGEWNAAVVARVNAMMGFNKVVGPINWDVDGNDWDCWQKKTSPDACTNAYLAILNARPKQNGIFLMHDRPEFNVTYEGPLLMARILVPRLKAAGFKFATMDDVLKMAPRDAGAACSMPPAATDAGEDPRSSPDAGPAADASRTVSSDGALASPDAGGAAGSGGAAGTAGKGGATGGGGSAGMGTPGMDEGTGGGGGRSGMTAGSRGCALAGARHAPEAAPAVILLAAVLRVRRRQRRAVSGCKPG